MEAATIPILKDRLRELGLSTLGRKADLVQRLLDAGITEMDSQHRSEENVADCVQAEVSQPSLLEGTTMPGQLQAEANLLRREKELAERELELLRREMELLRTSPQISNFSNDHRRTTFEWRCAKDMLPEYDGTDRDYDTWERQVRTVIETCRLNELEGKAVVCAKLTGNALKWFQSRVDCASMSLDTLLQELKKMFSLRLSKLQLRRNFEERVWKTDESFADYLHAKIVLGNLIPIDDDEMVDYVIEGIPDASLQAQARIQRFTSTTMLLEAFSKINLRALKTTGKSLRKSENHVSPGERNKDSTRRQHSGPMRCYNCNETGHRITECTRPKRERGSCFRCGSTDHQVRQCTVSKESVNYVGEVKEDEFHRRVQIEIENSGVACKFEIVALLDSGSPISFIKARYVSHESFVKDTVVRSFHGINGSLLRPLGKVKAQISCNARKHLIEMYVVPNGTMTSSVVLGRDFLREAGYGLQAKTQISEENEILNIDVNFTEVERESDRICINEDLPADVKYFVRELFDREYSQPQRPDKPAIGNFMTLTLADNKPFSCSPRRLSFTEKAKLKTIIGDLLKRNIIRPSESEYASPIVLVKKKTGELRMCVDFRTLNKVTIRDNFPLPLIEDQLMLLEGKKYFTTLDLRDGFYHISMHPESVKFTSFVTPLGQYEFLKMPFGLKGAPLRFQRFVTEIFRPLIDAGDVAIYLDDFLIATKTLEYHFTVLRKVFKLLVDNCLTLRLDKCKFVQTKLDYLGYTVTSEGIRPTDNGLKAVREFPIPKNAHEVRSFLGLCQYFRKFVENFALIAKPLYDLLKKEVAFKFDVTEIRAFELLKECLTQVPILSIYSPHDETELHCDASALGFGAILIQRKPDKKFHPIFYFSKRTTEVESRYHSFELETLSIIYALRRFRPYLQGIRFKIVTDCQSLTLTLNKKETNPRIARWALELQNYDYVIEHRAGQRMAHVDALSRQPNILVIEDNSFDKNLALSQDSDQAIVDIREKLQKSEDALFEMRNGLVYRKKKGEILFYVPEKLETSVLRKYHDEMGHVGADKTYENITRSYWFPKIREKVNAHIKACLKCIAFSPPSGKVEGYLHNIPKGDVPYHTLHVDHLGPLSKTHSLKYRYVLVIIDAFTKFIRLYPTKTTSSSEAIKCLQDYFRAYSRPIRIISDRGTTFTSREFMAFVNELNIQHLKVATASPQANGQVERINRVITPMIAKLTAERDTHWYNVLSDVEYAYNNSPNRSTGDTPSKLLFGLCQRGNVIDGLRETLELREGKVRNFTKIRSDARANIEKNQAINKRNYDKKRKDARKYEVGDRVMVRNFETKEGVSTKLIPRFKGPYEIKKVLRNDRYVVADVDGFEISQIPYKGTWEAANMRPWMDP